MAKSTLRLKARTLRRKGISVIAIANELRVSKSTVSLWVRDIILTIQQLETLRHHSLQGAERGRIIGALKQKQARLAKIEEGNADGSTMLGIMTEREFFTAGVALYWAEGNKKMKKIELCNSDPQMIIFFLLWLKHFFQMTIDDVRCYVGINILHKSRDRDVKRYWSQITGIPLKQFTKTSFKKSASRKIYDNFEVHYGTLSIRILKPARLLYTIAGLVHSMRTIPLSG